MKNTRDFFGKLLYISTQEKLDLVKVFSYPLLDLPTLWLLHREWIYDEDSQGQTDDTVGEISY